jgi:hypothetical protein
MPIYCDASACGKACCAPALRFRVDVPTEHIAQVDAVVVRGMQPGSLAASSLTSAQGAHWASPRHHHLDYRLSIHYYSYTRWAEIDHAPLITQSVEAPYRLIGEH